jgi:hypothetical protein
LEDGIEAIEIGALMLWLLPTTRDWVEAEFEDNAGTVIELKRIFVEAGWIVGQGITVL